VPLLALDTIRDRRGTRGRPLPWILLALVAATSPWLSFGSVFAVTATFAVATFLWWPRARPGTRRAWVGILSLWTASFLVLFAMALARQSSSTRMIAEWSDDMAFVYDAAPALRPFVALLAYFRTPLDYLFPAVAPLAVAVIAVGFFTAPRAFRVIVGTIVAVSALEVVAAVLIHRYVLTQGRLLLFAAPPYVIFAALGLVALGRLAHRRRGATLGLAVAALAATAWTVEAVRHRLPPVADDPGLYFRFDVLHDIDPLIEAASQIARPDEPVFVSRYSGEMFRFYHRGRLASATVCTRVNCRNEGPAVIDWLRTVERRGYMILLDSDDSRGRRELVAQAGCVAEIVARSRGMRLWRVTRQRPAG
jgi:hypothetical protein